MCKSLLVAQERTCSTISVRSLCPRARVPLIGAEVEKEKVNFSDLCTKVDTANQDMIEKYGELLAEAENRQ